MAGHASRWLPRDRILLRDVEEGDLPTFFEHQLDPEANRMAAFAARDRDAFTAHWIKILDDQSVSKKTILFDGDVAGNVVSWDQSGNQQIGYWIGQEYWGRGLGTRALSAFLEAVEARPLHAHVAKHNVASIRVLEKCGFTICDEDTVSDARAEEVEEFIMKLEAATDG